MSHDDSVARKAWQVDVLVVSDVRIFREGLAFALRQERAIRVVRVACAADQVLARLSAEPADVVLVDVAIPDGPRLIGQVTALAPHAGLVALGLAENDAEVMPWVEAGIAGYLPPDGSLADLVGIIQSINRREFLCSPQIAATLLRRVQALGGKTDTSSEHALSRREWEIASCLAEGLSNKAIARRLSIRTATVKNHVHRVLDKLEVSGRREVAARLGSGVQAVPPSRARA